MRKRIAATVLLSACAVCFCSGQSFGFGIPQGLDAVKSSVPGANLVPSSVYYSRSDIDYLYRTVADADALLNESMEILAGMLFNKDEVQKYKLKMKEIEAIKNTKEKDAALKNIHVEMQAAVEKQLTLQETASVVKQLNAQQRLLFCDAVYNVGLAGLLDTDAVLQAKNIVQYIQGSPTASISYAADIKKIGAVTTNLPTQSVKVVTLANNLVKLAKTGKIEVKIPQAKTEKAKPVNSGW